MGVKGGRWGVGEAKGRGSTDATHPNGDDSHTSGTGARRPLQVALACQVKFATCTLQGNALTWWNHVKTTTPEAAHAMPWRTLKKIMTDKYCPRGEIKKQKIDQVEKKCRLLALYDHAVTQADNKRNLMTLPRQQLKPKQQIQTRIQTPGKANARAGNGDRTPYGGLNLCVPNESPKVSYYWLIRAFECGAKGISRRDCPKLQNNNNGNQAGMQCSGKGCIGCGHCRGKPGTDKSVHG
ncbi:putative reverse transcriptase domain-containing protein [Tanacetum coccineum]